MDVFQQDPPDSHFTGRAAESSVPCTLFAVDFPQDGNLQHNGHQLSKEQNHMVMEPERAKELVCPVSRRAYVSHT